MLSLCRCRKDKKLLRAQLCQKALTFQPYLTTQLQHIVIKNGKQFCIWTMGGHLGQVEHPGSDTVTYVEVLLRQVDHLEGQAKIR